jgi:hypothetical protein
MTEEHHARLSVDGLTATLREKSGDYPDPRAAEPFDLDDLETLLSAAEERARPRTEWPPQLNYFPFNRSPRLRQLVLKLYKRLFHDQRAVNVVLIQALRETLAVNRYLLDALAARGQAPARTGGLPRLRTADGEEGRSCAS